MTTQLYSFADLCRIEFNLNYLSISNTLERPLRFFSCRKNTRRFDRFFYITEGEFTIQQDGCDALTLHAGEMLYLPSDCVYTSEWTSEAVGYISAEFILSDEQGAFSLSEKIFTVLRDKNGVVCDLLERLNAVWTKGGIGYRIKMYSLFFELLHHTALENVKADLKLNCAGITAAILYLENNYTGEFTVSELARMCGMCESNFRARFLEYAGIPPVQYRNRLRAKKAAELLSSGEYTVSEAAESVGIPDLAYFNRVFKRYCGTNPSKLMQADN